MAQNLTGTISLLFHQPQQSPNTVPTLPPEYTHNAQIQAVIDKTNSSLS